MRRSSRPKKKPGRNSWGSVRWLPSGNWQATYPDPERRVNPKNGREVRHVAPHTFVSEQDGAAWLVRERAAISAGTWVPPADRRPIARPPLAQYAAAWIDRREREGLATNSVRIYRNHLRLRIGPALGDIPVDKLTRARVVAWLDTMPATETRAGAYRLLVSVMRAAVEQELIASTPCTVRGASSAPPQRTPRALPPDDVTRLVEAMRPHLRLAVLLAAWCGLRAGEVLGLARRHVELEHDDGVTVGAWLQVRRQPTPDGFGKLKTERSVRDVPVPPHVLADLVAHLDDHVGGGQDALLFPGRDASRAYAKSSLVDAFDVARRKAKLPEVHFHDLRHTALTAWRVAGATEREVMELGGHASAVVALGYQHASRDRLVGVAAKMVPDSSR